ncbi:MAG: SDR family NAD(P)-dependent oxidoreductase [Gulosibacter sp.]|uniref:SDR family NAD(P)-dependent oxidoreductase n=1 Tax=Gulosibacter sp. TaxID=2817531 RepID=UPI003F90D032
MVKSKPPVVLITGAASGMGRCTAERFLAEGWTVLSIDRVPTELSHGKGQRIEIVADVTDREALDQALANHLPEAGPLRAVANIAGIYPPSTLDSVTPQLFRAVFDTNVLGVINMMAAASKFLDSGAAIVNFASVDGYQVSPGQLVYGASKAAVIMLTKSVALELAPRNIRVNAIAPGWVATPGTAKTERIAQAAESIPLGRVAQPEEIAEWVWILSSTSASYVTGETITIAGGFATR